jgi:hypothetical protein
MTNVYLDRRKTEKLTRGGKVKVSVDGETVWIEGTDVRGDL